MGYPCNSLAKNLGYFFVLCLELKERYYIFNHRKPNINTNHAHAFEAIKFHSPDLTYCPTCIILYMGHRKEQYRKKNASKKLKGNSKEESKVKGNLLYVVCTTATTTTTVLITLGINLLAFKTNFMYIVFETKTVTLQYINWL